VSENESVECDLNGLLGQNVAAGYDGGSATFFSSGYAMSIRCTMFGKLYVED